MTIKAFEIVFAGIVLFLVIALNGLLHQMGIFNWGVVLLNVMVVIRFIRAILLIRTT